MTQFEAFKKHNLPIEQYAITGSGPLGIRALREIGDIDIIVTPALWEELAKKYGVTIKNNIEKIIFTGEPIEAFKEGSFLSPGQEFHDAPSVTERIAKAEIIEGLSFESLEHVLYYKRKMAREKDRQDIDMIEAWIKLNSSHNR